LAILAAIRRTSLLGQRCVERFTEPFDKSPRRRQIRKAQTKIGLAFSNNSPSVSDLNLSRPMEIHHSAVQLDTQFASIDEKLDDK
jgi:hypothetical protein